MNLDGLTHQQQCVFDLLVHGYTNREIGELLGSAEKTVKAHVTGIFNKLECTSRSKLIARYYLERTA